MEKKYIRKALMAEEKKTGKLANHEEEKICKEIQVLTNPNSSKGRRILFSKCREDFLLYP